MPSHLDAGEGGGGRGSREGAEGGERELVYARGACVRAYVHGGRKRLAARREIERSGSEGGRTYSISHRITYMNAGRSSSASSKVLMRVLLSVLQYLTSD